MLGRGLRSDDAVRRAASDWVTLIHDPEAAVDRAAFERWRAADPRHGVAYARAERAWDSAGLLGETRFARARGLPEPRRFSDRPQVRYAFAAAAVLVVALLGLSFAGRQWLSPDRAAPATELASTVGQIRTLTLSDGSTVTLDTDSLVRVAFGDTERRLYLTRGRARFVVAHDAARPFVVMAGSGAITARGTIFDVAITGDRVNVVLLRGAIDVRGGGTSLAVARRPIARLTAGQRISFAAAEPLPPPGLAPTAAEEWTTGMLTFDRTRLADALADANRYSTTKISLADPVLADLRITGAYHVGDAAGLAESIAASLGLRTARMRDGGIALAAPAGKQPS